MGKSVDAHRWIYIYRWSILMKLLLVAFQTSFAIFLPLFGMKIRSFVWRVGGSIAKESTLFGYGTASWVIPGAWHPGPFWSVKAAWNNWSEIPLLRRVYIYIYYINIIHSLRFWIKHCSVCSVDLWFLWSRHKGRDVNWDSVVRGPRVVPGMLGGRFW